MKYASGIRFFFTVIISGLALTSLASLILVDRSISYARESQALSLDIETEILEKYLEKTRTNDYSVFRPYFDFISGDSSLSDFGKAAVSYFVLPDGKKIFVGRNTEYIESLGVYRNVIAVALGLTVLLSLISIVMFTRENVQKPLKIMGELAKTNPEPENLIKSMKGIIVDLEEKKKELENLYSLEKQRARRTDLRSGAVLQSLKAGIIDIDAEGKIVQTNIELVKIFGESAENLTGNLDESALPEEIVTAVYDCLREKILKRTRIDLSGKIIEQIVSPVMESQQIVGAVSVFYDMTETVLLERMFLTREKMLSLTEISAGVSHEFRNSAGVLLALATAIHQKHGDENAELLLDETKSLVGIVENFSRLAQRKDKSFVEFDLREMTEEIKKFYRWDFRTDLRVNIFKGDKDLIRRALINILQNSVEASQYSPADILITADKMDSWQRIEITDKAGGIREEHLEKIKAPFYTLKKEGVGLGLSIVEKIIQMHSGSLEIKNFENGLKVTMTWSCDE